MEKLFQLRIQEEAQVSHLWSDLWEPYCTCGYRKSGWCSKYLSFDWLMILRPIWPVFRAFQWSEGRRLVRGRKAVLVGSSFAEVMRSLLRSDICEEIWSMNNELQETKNYREISFQLKVIIKEFFELDHFSCNSYQVKSVAFTNDTTKRLFSFFL